MRVVGWATFCVEGKNFSFDAPKRKQRGRLWLCSRNVPTMEKREFTAKEKDRSFAVEEVGGDPPTWEDEEEVKEVASTNSESYSALCSGHFMGRCPDKLLMNRAAP